MSRPLALTTLTLAVAFFLAVLGMRIPALDHNHGPKQRPRAVVEKIFKAQIENPSKLQPQLDLHISPVTARMATPAEVQPLFLPTSYQAVATPDTDSISSRAPPAPSSILS